MNRSKVQLRQRNHRAYLNGIARQEGGRRPNIVLIMVDDMGHGDLSCFGSRAIHTPHLDALAARGVRMTNFYASSPLCSPSRFSCLTGRYPLRNFIHYVYFPTVDARGLALNRQCSPYGILGILPDEVTVAEALQRSGYRTGIFGKWHLGDRSPHLPNEKGFDYFFGAYYSNDMKPYAYYRNSEVVLEAPADQTRLTGEITREILGFIEENREEPFFVYYPSPFPHDPAHASAAFTGSSRGGTFGDCVQEIDWSVGEIWRKLEELGLAENTLFIFTSDNGPWYEGSPGLHRGRKGNNFDGGQIVPLVAAWPGVIPAGITVDTAAMNIDFFPTFLKLAGVALPADREIDGRDMLEVLRGKQARCAHEALFFVGGKEVRAVRTDENYKYIDRDASENTFYRNSHQGPFLFDLGCDQDESYDVTAHYPEKAAELRALLEAKREAFAANPRGWI